MYIFCKKLWSECVSRVGKISSLCTFLSCVEKGVSPDRKIIPIGHYAEINLVKDDYS